MNYKVCTIDCVMWDLYLKKNNLSINSFYFHNYI